MLSHYSSSCRRGGAHALVHIDADVPPALALEQLSSDPCAWCPPPTWPRRPRPTRHELSDDFSRTAVGVKTMRSILWPGAGSPKPCRLCMCCRSSLPTICGRVVGTATAPPPRARRWLVLLVQQRRARRVHEERARDPRRGQQRLRHVLHLGAVLRHAVTVHAQRARVMSIPPNRVCCAP